MARLLQKLPGTAPAPRKEMLSPRLGEQEFKRRYLEQFRDPAFGKLADEIERIADVDWEAYSTSRKSPVTRRAGPEFADPDYELSVDWLAARDAIGEAERRHRDEALPLRILLINGSSRSEHTCPGETSKSYRLAAIARSTLETEMELDVELLDLSRLASEYGRRIHPCKACSPPPHHSATGPAPAPAIPTIRWARPRTG